MRQSSITVALLALVAGCGGGGDGGSTPVADASGMDAARDMGAAELDLGTGELDLGTGELDLGTGELDSGSVEVDSGGGGLDSGPPDGCGGGPACVLPFSCTAGGYCASATGVPAFDHVYVMIFENRSLTSVRGHAPYLDSLASAGASATRYISVTHPSLPNYIAMTSGDFWGVACDCHPGATNSCNVVTCNLLLSSCDCPIAEDHLGNQLDALGVSWREYGEGMGTPCNGEDDGSRHYAAKHLPFLYYSDVFDDTARCTDRVRDYGDFAADLASGAYRFTMISPDLCNDMHDACGGDPVAHGDTWASTNVPPILATPGFAEGGRDVLFIVWDEEDLSIGDAPIPFIVVSPLARPGAITDVRYDHYSLLATWQDAFGAPRLARSATAPPIADIWR